MSKYARVSLRPRKIGMKRKAGRSGYRNRPKYRRVGTVGSARTRLHPRHSARYSTRSGSTKSVRERTYRDANQYRQMETFAHAYGRKDRGLVYMNKLIRSSYNYNKYIIRGLGFDDDGGAGIQSLFTPLGFNDNSSSTQQLPILIFSLCNIPQGVAGSPGSRRDTPAAWRVAQDSVSGVISFPTIDQRTTAGTVVNARGWEAYIAQGQAAANNTPVVRRALMEYVSMKFRIRGPVNRPTFVYAQIVQPYAWFNGMPEDYLLSSGAITNENHQEWINMANRLTANPVQSVPSGIKRPWRVLKFKKFELQPTSTTETDVSGHDVVQKWFWRCNRMINYDHQAWINTDNATATDLNIGDGTVPSATVRNIPERGKRLYLIVSAYAPNLVPTQDPLLHPSIDWSFEKKYSSLTGNFVT